MQMYLDYLVRAYPGDRSPPYLIVQEDIMNTTKSDRVFTAVAGISRGDFPGVKVNVEAAVRELQDAGFKPGYVSDLKVGDIWVKEPDTFPYWDYATMVLTVLRIFKQDGSYVNEDDDFVVNTVVNMICYGEDGLERHITYGSSHGVYIYRGL